MNRYYFGVEKPFYYDTLSVDVRLPFASTLASEQNLGTLGSSDTQFGNMTSTLKGVLLKWV